MFGTPTTMQVSETTAHLGDPLFAVTDLPPAALSTVEAAPLPLPPVTAVTALERVMQKTRALLRLVPPPPPEPPVVPIVAPTPLIPPVSLILPPVEALLVLEARIAQLEARIQVLEGPWWWTRLWHWLLHLVRVE